VKAGKLLGVKRRNGNAPFEQDLEYERGVTIQYQAVV
jgi:hypothetical protein